MSAQTADRPLLGNDIVSCSMLRPRVDESEPTVGWRYWLLAPRQVRIGAPLASPWDAVPARAGRMHAVCKLTRHAAPAVGCRCGFTSTEDLGLLAEYLWHAARATDRACELAGYRTSYLDRVVISQCVLAGARTRAPERGFVRHAEVEVTALSAPARLAGDAARLWSFYGVPVHAGASDGELWLQHLAAGQRWEPALCGWCLRRRCHDESDRNLCRRCARIGPGFVASFCADGARLGWAQRLT